MKCKAIFLFCIILIFIGTSCNKLEQQYDFPLKLEDIEALISEKGLDWKLDDTFGEEIKDRVMTYVFKNETGMDFIIRSSTYDYLGYEGERGIGFSWNFPLEMSDEEIKEFYYEELSEYLDLVSVFYGNTKGLKKDLMEFIKYYKKVENDYQQGMYWEKRSGDKHISIDVRNGFIKYGSLNIYPNGLYEGVILPSKYEDWKRSAEYDSIEIKNMTVDEINNIKPVNDEDFYLKHFIVQGHLENIKEIKVVPKYLELTQDTRAYYFKPNKDKYLSAKLVDETGSMDIFVQTTSLNKKELGEERNHNMVLYYHDKETPVFIIRFSPLADKN